ncbi:hypothetical protein GCM10010347_64410 [Streptomyces cirratus]|uniref:Uncharacterized protein n=1 Tax=Streptomyces cirratus TaxID=68187 RepID=A0ABQ3F588_9ACTN|nr:hypothetical protein GCM10010347_64410 [Streptomyces cirratus]
MWSTLPDSILLESIDQDKEPAELVELGAFPHRNPLAPVELHRVPLPVPTTRRAGWRVTALVLILGSCRATSATTEQLHCLLWAISDTVSASLFTSTWQNRDPRKAPLRKFFPPLEDALKLALAEGLIEPKAKGRYSLSIHGKNYLRLLSSDSELMTEEKTFLAPLRPISTSGMWQKLGITKANGRAETGAST